MERASAPMWAVPLNSWLVLFTSLSMSTSTMDLAPDSHRHEPIDMYSSYSWSVEHGTAVKITCALCGPPQSTIMWRKGCFDVKTTEKVPPKNNSKTFVTKTVNDDPWCRPNKTEGISVMDVKRIESTYYTDTLPPSSINCRLTCCGYPMVNPRLPSPKINASVSLIEHHLGDKIIYSGGMSPEELEKLQWDRGVCKSTTTEHIAEVDSEGAFYIEMVVLIMAAVTFVSVMGTFIFVYIVDFKSNVEKSNNFKKWVYQKKFRRLMAYNQHMNQLQRFSPASKDLVLQPGVSSERVSVNLDTGLLCQLMNVDMDTLRAHFNMERLERMLEGVKVDWLPNVNLGNLDLDLNRLSSCPSDREDNLTPKNSTIV